MMKHKSCKIKVYNILYKCLQTYINNINTVIPTAPNNSSKEFSAEIYNPLRQA